MKPIRRRTDRNETERTMTVDLKVIQIGKRHMTLVLFCQLKEESILRYDLQLKGKPWGIVRCPLKYEYDHGLCDSSIPKETFVIERHLIWQKGKELRRMPLDINWSGLGYVEEGVEEDLDAFLDTWVEKLDQLFIDL